MNYNEIYVNAYSEDYYNSLLKDKNSLNNIASKYSNRYKDNFVGEYYLLKESLDHYVVKKLLMDSNFKDSQEFINYINYLLQLISNDNQELNSNVVLRNPNVNKYILKNIDSKKLNKLTQTRKDNRERLIEIFAKMDIKPSALTQKDVDLAAQYLYENKFHPTSKHEHNYKIFINYFFNIAKTNPNIQVSYQMLNAYSYYVQMNYLDNMKIDNTFYIDNFKDKMLSVRPILCTIPTINEEKSGKSGFRVGRSSGNQFYIDQRTFKDFDLNSNVGYESARLKNGVADIPFLTVLISHEFTHNIQKKKTKISNYDKQGFSGLVHTIAIEEYRDKNKGLHDGFYQEIDADYLGWMNTKSILDNFNCKYDKHIVNRYIKAIAQRNLFSLVKNNNDDNISNLSSYQIYDKVIEEVKKNPKLIEQYPMLKNFFSSDGEISAKFLTGKKMNDCEVIDFYTNALLNHKGFSLLGKELEQHKYSSEEVENIILHLMSIAYRNLTRCESVDYALETNLGETRTNFNEEEKMKYYEKWTYDALRIFAYYAFILELYPSYKNDEMLGLYANALDRIIHKYPELENSEKLRKTINLLESNNNTVIKDVLNQMNRNQKTEEQKQR